MKRIMAIGLLALAGFFAAGGAEAYGPQPHYQTIQYGSFQQRAPATSMGSCIQSRWTIEYGDMMETTGRKSAV
jgi:hypothetical protein